MICFNDNIKHLNDHVNKSEKKNKDFSISHPKPNYQKILKTLKPVIESPIGMAVLSVVLSSAYRSSKIIVLVQEGIADLIMEKVPKLKAYRQKVSVFLKLIVKALGWSRQEAVIKWTKKGVVVEIDGKEIKKVETVLRDDLRPGETIKFSRPNPQYAALQYIIDHPEKSKTYKTVWLYNASNKAIIFLLQKLGMFQHFNPRGADIGSYTAKHMKEMLAKIKYVIANIQTSWFVKKLNQAKKKYDKHLRDLRSEKKADLSSHLKKYYPKKPSWISPKVWIKIIYSWRFQFHKRKDRYTTSEVKYYQYKYDQALKKHPPP